MRIVYSEFGEIITAEDIEQEVSKYASGTWKIEAAVDWFEGNARDVPAELVNKVLDLRKDVEIHEKRLREVYDDGR